MTTRQPVWKLVANLWDVNPLEHGGYFVFKDTTGVYPPEGELYDPESGKVYRVVLDPLHLYNGNLILKSIWNKHESGHALPYPLEEYTEWMNDSIEDIASFVGMSGDELRGLLCSDDPRELAQGYRAVYDFHGWENGDGSPVYLTPSEAKKRYSKYLKG